jgi:hypothetical protein
MTFIPGDHIPARRVVVMREAMRQPWRSGRRLNVWQTCDAKKEVPMRAGLALSLLAAGMGWTPARVSAECAHQEPREATVEVRGARTVRVIAGAGGLRIEGRASATAVAIHGTACAADAETLGLIRLVAERQGDTVHVEAVMPDGEHWRSESPRLDLVLEVPDSLPLDVTDGSGEASIRGVAALKVDDGSGELEIENVRGEVVVTDGSGEVSIRDAGSVLVKSDGSGSLRFSGVRGDVVVRDDGSGSIEVADVGGDLTVDKDGSGGVRHRGVKGKVRVPSR